MKVKQFLMAALIAALGVGFVATEVQAKRLGGGSSQGMKRQAPPPQTPPQQAPAQPAATPGANAAMPGAAAAAAAPKRNWMGPIAGIAAGLGIAALMSHLGLGAGMANFLVMLLIGVALFFVVRFVMARMRGPQPAAAAAGAGAGGFGGQMPFSSQPGSRLDAPPAHAGGAAGAFAPAAFTPASVGSAESATPASRLPDGFDAHGFERIAKLIFIRMQAANDAANLEDLRQFSTPEMFAAFRLDLQDRKGVNQTDVVRLDAQVVDYAEEDGKQIISVRFHGLLREEVGGAAAPFDEVWHLVKPADGSSTQWLIAGIQQS